MASEKLSPEGRQERQNVLSGTLRRVGRWGLYWWRGSRRGCPSEKGDNCPLAVVLPTARLLAEYDEGIGCTVGLVPILEVDAEVDIP